MANKKKKQPTLTDRVNELEEMLHESNSRIGYLEHNNQFLIDENKKNENQITKLNNALKFIVKHKFDGEVKSSKCDMNIEGDGYARAFFEYLCAGSLTVHIRSQVLQYRGSARKAIRTAKKMFKKITKITENV